MSESLHNAIVELNEDHTLHLVSEKINAGEEPTGIVEDLGRGMETVTERFEKGEYGLAELHMATEIFNECTKLIQPKLKEVSAQVQGKVVLGKVIGRREDFSREPVAGMLRAAGFEVYDLGEDIPAQQFIDKAKEVDADIIGICGLETTAVRSAKNTISDIRASGVKAKILVGAGMLCGCSIVVDDKMRRTVGADAAWNGVREAVELAKKAVAKEA
ncbi:MAG: B12-binding domain-containing protein [Nitrososphaerales archaeon]